METVIRGLGRLKSLGLQNSYVQALGLANLEEELITQEKGRPPSLELVTRSLILMQYRQKNRLIDDVAEADQEPAIRTTINSSAYSDVPVGSVLVEATTPQAWMRWPDGKFEPYNLGLLEDFFSPKFLAVVLSVAALGGLCSLQVISIANMPIPILGFLTSVPGKEMSQENFDRIAQQLERALREWRYS